jgi:hypothetical protein
MTLKFNPDSQDFRFEGNELANLNAEIKSDAAKKDGHYILADKVVQHVVNIRRPYQSYASRLFFADQMPAGPGTPAVAVEDYVGLAGVGVATNNTPMYIRSGMTFVTPTRFYTQGAAWYYMDDVRVQGFNVLDRTAKQIAEEMGKGIDTKLFTLLDAAIPAGQKFSASLLDLETWKYVIGEAEDAGYPITDVVFSKSRALDMSSWETGTADIQWMWAPLPGEYGAQIARQGYITNFMGVNAGIEFSIPKTVAYFFGDPLAAGRIMYTVEGIQQLMDQDIDSKTIRHRWDQLFEVYCATALDVWKVTFTG